VVPFFEVGELDLSLSPAGEEERELSRALNEEKIKVLVPDCRLVLPSDFLFRFLALKLGEVSKVPKVAEALGFHAVDPLPAHASNALNVANDLIPIMRNIFPGGDFLDLPVGVESPW
jgi:hypothetical protein